MTSVITLTLLHPLQSIPVQNWTFASESVIRIGRSTENNVILYSAVVSRHHVELRRHGDEWEVVSLGANGTYLEGKRITQAPVVDGMIIRLASSGPQIQIRMGATESKSRQNTVAGKQSSPKTEGQSKDKDTFIDPSFYEGEDTNQSKEKLLNKL